eukprot:12927014-Prorocentrum_lima.AAC.1
MEPGTILTAVRDTTEMVVFRDDILKKTLMDELSQPALRNPQNLIDMASFVRIMLGEVRLRAKEDKSAKASREVSTRLSPPHTSTA